MTLWRLFTANLKSLVFNRLVIEMTPIKQLIGTRRQGQLSGCELAELTLTSQTWRDIVCKHQLFLIKPDRLVEPSHAMLLIDGGRWTD
ncbi:MAG: PhoPQ-activated pathogenicity-related family protein, partial [Firmicutes bacterium]|nr:PhoPQ-activated pathogenicity-related family protein [Bacillota bacterium]